VAEDTRLEAEALTRAAALQRRDGPTLEAELRDYVEKKRRAKDGLALKARTRSDYLAAIEPPRVTKRGTKRAAGPLHPIAHKALATLTASDIRATYEAAARRSLRRAEYAMQILRAVLRWNGVVIPGNPLGSETAGRDRITIPTGKGGPAPIPPELLGAWWRAAERAPSQVASDYYRFSVADGVSRRGDPRTQAAQVPTDQGRGRRPTGGQGASAGHEELERSQAAAVLASARDR
jgi:hypothetical protein